MASSSGMSSSSGMGGGGPGPMLLDPTFGKDGISTVGIAGSNGDSARAVARQADGKFVVAATTNVSPLGSVPIAGELLLVRMGVDGAVDPNFGVNGKALVSIGLHATADAVMVQSDQKIVVVGHYDAASMGSLVYMARFTSNGALDPSFGKGGIVAIDGLVAYSASVAFGANGKVVLRAKNFENKNVVMRLLPDGNLDSSFGVGGVQAMLPVTISAGGPIAVQADGKILVASSVGSGTTQDTVVVRLLPDGAVDMAYGVAGQALAKRVVARLA